MLPAASTRTVRLKSLPPANPGYERRELRNADARDEAIDRAVDLQSPASAFCISAPHRASKTPGAHKFHINSSPPAPALPAQASASSHHVPHAASTSGDTPSPAA